MCDPRDLGATMGDAEDRGDERRVGRRFPEKSAVAQPGYSPTLFLYEHVPGGIGLSERIFAQREALVARALRLIASARARRAARRASGPATRRGYFAQERGARAVAGDIVATYAR